MSLLRRKNCTMVRLRRICGWMIVIILVTSSHSMPARVASANGSAKVYLPMVTRAYDPGYINPFGIALYDNVDDSQGLSLMRNAGSRWVTTVLSWVEIEPIKGQRNWASFDVKVNNARAAQMDVFVLFTNNPAWAAQYLGGPVYNSQDLVSIVTEMTERYDGDGFNDAPGSPVVRYWSFYAEPDNRDLSLAPGGKGVWGNNGAGYAQMLSQIAPAIHSASPAAKVLIGGLAYDSFTTEGGGFVRSFLADTLAALNTYPGGAGYYLDAFAFHFFPISAARWPTIRDKALELKGILQQHGVGHLPMLVPETGHWSEAVPHIPMLSSTPMLQAQKLVQIHVHGLSAGILNFMWLGVVDHGPYTEAHGLFFDAQMTSPKPAYAAYQTMTRELTFFRYVRTLNGGGSEGYVFRNGEAEEKTVAWSQNPSATTLPFANTCLRVVDLLGAVSQIQDGGAGDQDQTPGQITLRLEPNHPVYVGRCPP